MKENALKILVVDDEAAMREVLDARLRRWGYEVCLASNCSEAEELVYTFNPQVIISDLVLPDVSGLELLASLQGADADRAVILITAYGSIDIAVEAMKRGAKDFLTKPIDYDELKALIEESARELKLRREVSRLRDDLDRGAGLGLLVGRSKPQKELYALIRTVAEKDTPVIITGESGTGKELVARTIHQLSGRTDGPFVAVNAAAIPEGLTERELLGHQKGSFTGAVSTTPGFFEMAHTGTLFLDEITEMPMSLQPKLLRVLEDGRVRRIGGKEEISFRVCIIAATNRDPESAVQEGQLRADLYYRLSVFTLALAPLRKRREDIPLLAQHFVVRFNRKHNSRVDGLRPEALELLRAYPWPGNVRELSNVIERAIILAKKGWIETRHLPHSVRGESAEVVRGIVLPFGVTKAEAERILILETLKRVGYNKAEAARQLDVDVKTIRHKLKAYGLASPQE